MDSENFGLLVLFILGLIMGAVLGTVIEKINVNDRLARGEWECRYYHEEVVCWNPKEEEPK